MPGPTITFDLSKPVPISPSEPPPPTAASVEVKVTPPPPSGTTLTFKVTVTDNLGHTKSQTIAVRIQGNLTLKVTAPKIAAPNAPIGLTATAGVQGGTISNYNWQLEKVDAPKPAPPKP
jgi:hypothetical protein